MHQRFGAFAIRHLSASLQQKTQKVWTLASLLSCYVSYHFSTETTLTSTTSNAFVFTRRHRVSQDKGFTTLTRRIWLFHQVFTLTSVATFKDFVQNFQTCISPSLQNTTMSRSHGPLASPAAGECHPAQSTV